MHRIYVAAVKRSYALAERWHVEHAWIGLFLAWRVLWAALLFAGLPVRSVGYALMAAGLLASATRPDLRAVYLAIHGDLMTRRQRRRWARAQRQARRRLGAAQRRYGFAAGAYAMATGTSSLPQTPDVFATLVDAVSVDAAANLNHLQDALTALMSYAGVGPVFYNIKGPQFNAKGDNTQDDTVPIQNTVNACSTGTPSAGGTVFAPPGTFKVTASIQYKSQVRFVGAGPDVTTFQASMASAVFASATPAARTYSVHWKDLTINNGTTARGTASSVGIDMTNLSHARGYNVYINNAITGVILASSAYYNHFFGVNCTSNQTGWQVNTNENSWFGCRSGDTTADGWFFNSGNSCGLYGCSCETFAVGVYINAGSIRVMGLRLETGTTGIQITAAASRTFVAGLHVATTTTAWTDASADAIILGSDGWSKVQKLQLTGHESATGTAPAVSGVNANINAGTVAVTGNDMGGRVAFTTTGNIAAGGTLFTLTYSSPYTNRPFVMVVGSNGQPVAYATYAGSATTVTIICTTALSTGTAYELEYVVRGNVS